jgi:hypothetical protein
MGIAGRPSGSRHGWRRTGCERWCQPGSGWHRPLARAGYAALFQDGPEFDLDLVESTVLDGRTLKLVYGPHLHTGIPEGVGPQRRET